MIVGNEPSLCYALTITLYYFNQNTISYSQSGTRQYITFRRHTHRQRRPRTNYPQAALVRTLQIIANDFVEK